MSQPNTTSQNPRPLSAAAKNLSSDTYFPRSTPSMSKPPIFTFEMPRSSNARRSASTPKDLLRGMGTSLANPGGAHDRPLSGSIRTGPAAGRGAYPDEAYPDRPGGIHRRGGTRAVRRLSGVVRAAARESRRDHRREALRGAPPARDALRRRARDRFTPERPRRGAVDERFRGVPPRRGPRPARARSLLWSSAPGVRARRARR